MKKILFGALFLLAGIPSVTAQHVVSGKVTDKQGVPIPGARIETKGGTESTLSELDGTFRLESKTQPKRLRIDYVGMQSRTVKPSSETTVVLRKTNLWNRRPLRQQWFATLEAGFPESSSLSPSFGLSVGRMRTFGWYVKGLYRPIPEINLQPSEYGYVSSDTFESIPEQYWWKTGNVKKGFNTITAGGIARLGCALHLYTGVGYAWRQIRYEIAGGKWIDSENSYSNVAIDYGLILRLGRVLISGGTIMSFNDGAVFIGNAGIGICF